jgi:hypothetical protein
MKHLCWYSCSNTEKMRGIYFKKLEVAIVSSVNATGVKPPIVTSEAAASVASAPTAQTTGVVTKQPIATSDTVTISDEARRLLDSAKTDDTGIEPPKMTTLDTGIEPPKMSARDTGIEPPKQN